MQARRPAVQRKAWLWEWSGIGDTGAARGCRGWGGWFWWEVWWCLVVAGAGGGTTAQGDEKSGQMVLQERTAERWV
jgi:hypothetical protein